MTVSVRSYLTAGVVAVAASAIAAAPVAAPAPAAITSHMIRLSAAVQPLVAPAHAAAEVLGPAASTSGTTPAAPTATLAAQSAGDAIINAYNAIEPWAQWGFEVAAWAVGYVPVAGYFGSQINIAYDTGEPIVQSWVYSFAYLIDGNFSLIGPTLVNGVTQGITNLVQGEIQWILGYLPPLPPIPPFSAVAATSRSAAPQSAAAVPATAAEQQSDTVAPGDVIAAGTGHVATRRQLARDVRGDVATPVQDVVKDADQALTDGAAATQVKAVAATPRTVAKAVAAAQGGVRSAAASDVGASVPDAVNTAPAAVKSGAGHGARGGKTGKTAHAQGRQQ